MTKDMFEDMGVVKRIDTTGMAVFDMPKFSRDGKIIKNGKKVEMKLAVKCEVGDRVVLPVGKRRPFSVIPKTTWAEMPANKEEKAEIELEKNPVLKDVVRDVAELRKENAELRAKLEGGEKDA